MAYHSEFYRLPRIKFAFIGLLILASALVFAPIQASSPPVLTVDATSGRIAINPLIYGACGGGRPPLAFEQEIRLPLCRWGGDATSRYNWQANASNAGVDWYFLGSNGGDPTAGGQVDQMVTLNNAVGAKSLITVPIIPYIEKDGNPQCAYSLAKYGAANVGGGSAFPYGTWGTHPAGDCTNGLQQGSRAPYLGNDPTDTSKANTPAIQSAWVQHLVTKWGASSSSGIIYQLDNEVSNWNYLHRDVHPNKVTYPEIISLVQQYAPAIKTADPTAKVAAPSEIQFAWFPEWGGDTNVINFLSSMKTFDQGLGHRTLDSFDVHYPDTDGQYPKSTMVDHVRQLVDQYYPGTQLSFSEWNRFYNTLDPTNGALSTADELGVFARDNVYFAAFWADPTQTNAAFAYRMYRDYDGNAGSFGDTYVQSTSADDTQISVYSAIRNSDSALTVMIINKSASALASPLNLSHFNAGATAKVYRYNTANLAAIVRQSDQAVTASGFTATYPAHSITLVVIPALVTPHLDSIGIYRAGKFYLRLHNSTGNADLTAAFTAGTKPSPIVGDWAGSGFDSIGVMDQATANFYLRNTISAGSADEQFTLGNPNDTPLGGRWQISATHAGIGVYRPSNGVLYLKNALSTGFADNAMVMGLPGDLGIAGDWTGKGFDSPGIFRPGNIGFFLSNQVTSGPVFADINLTYGSASDLPIAGDWIAQGHDGIGMFRPTNGFVYLKNALTTGFADNSFFYGVSGDVPIAGHWQVTYPPNNTSAAPAPVLIAKTAIAPNGSSGSVIVPGDNRIGG